VHYASPLVKRNSIYGYLAVTLLAAHFAYVPPSCAQGQNEDLPATGVVLRNPPDRLRFFDVTGHKAGVFGRQTGEFEAWIYPIKLLHGFRLEFQEAHLLEPIRGEPLLREIITRPESTTFVYVHPKFTVRQITWIPLDQPAIITQFEVDSAEPIDITAAFVPDFHPMWPASLGGQHSNWLANKNAFVLTDGTEKAAALIGSSAVTDHSEFTDHQLGAGEMLLRFHLQPQGHPFLSAPLIFALSVTSLAEAQNIFDGVLSRASTLFQERVASHREYLGRTLALETPDPEINRAFLWAKLALDSGWVCHSAFGCGLVAGYGPSGTGERPGFAWWFGGDALMTSWAMEDFGDLPGALQALRFLKARQRSDGKMLHELSQSDGLIDWFGKYHYAYYHADTTPMYLYSIGQYWRHTGDRKFLEEFWPSIRKAWEYCESTVSSEDGLMDNTKAGLAAVEVGVLRGKVIKDLYLEGFWLGATEAMADLAFAMGDKKLGEGADLRSQQASASLGKAWWDPARQTFAFGISPDGQQAKLAGAWPAVPIALSSTLDSAKARLSAESLASPKSSADWGVRWLADDSPLYDPLSYNNGTAWPFMSGIAAWAEYKSGLPYAGFQMWRSLVNLTGLSSPGALPELMNGDRFLPGELAVPHQLFSSVAVVLPVVRGLLGLETNFASSSGPQVILRPTIPPDWPFLRFEKFAIPGGTLSGEVRQEPSHTTMFLRNDGTSPIEAKLAPAIPALARVSSLSVNGQQQRFTNVSSEAVIRLETPTETVRPGHTLTLSVEYQDGIAIVPPPVQPHPGERSSSLRILTVDADPNNHSCSMKIRVAGIGGREYPLQIVSGLPQLHAEKLALRKTSLGFEILIPFEGTGYVLRTLCLTE
jgi:hypothetical protein